MDKLHLRRTDSDKGNARDIYRSEVNGLGRYYTRQEHMTKGYTQWFTATKQYDGYEQEYPLKKGLLIVTKEGIEQTIKDGIAKKEYKFSWEE
jgi:hypothetical protein